MVEDGRSGPPALCLDFESQFHVQRFSLNSLFLLSRPPEDWVVPQNEVKLKPGPTLTRQLNRTQSLCFKVLLYNCQQLLAKQKANDSSGLQMCLFYTSRRHISWVADLVQPKAQFTFTIQGADSTCLTNEGSQRDIGQLGCGPCSFFFLV